MNQLANSYPLYVTTGLRGLLTEKTSAVLTLGYVNGFYSNGTSTGGFLGSTYLDLAFTARLTQLSRAVVGYRHDFINAVISFVIVAAVIYFFVIAPFTALVARFHKEPPADPTTKKCPECMSEIPIEARRCAFCGELVRETA